MSLANNLSIIVWNIDGAYYKGADICKLDDVDVIEVWNHMILYV